MSVAASKPRRNARSTITITLEQDAILAQLADVKFAGNRSAAVSHLIEVHAGKEIERELQAAESFAAPVQIVKWKPPVLSVELIGYVAGLVRAGNMEEIACNLAGITPRQRNSWLKGGRNDRREGRSSLQADFVAALEKAEAECEAEDIARLRKWGEERWQALAWRLERQYPDRYAQRKRIDGKVQHSLMPLVDYDRLTAAETKMLVELLRKASPELDDPSVGRASRPAIELVPDDVIDAVDGEWHELDAKAPALGEASSLGEAPALGGESPDPSGPDFGLRLDLGADGREEGGEGEGEGEGEGPSGRTDAAIQTADHIGGSLARQTAVHTAENPAGGTQTAETGDSHSRTADADTSPWVH